MARTRVATEKPKAVEKEVSEAPEKTKGKPGRPSKPPPAYIEALGTNHTIDRVPLSRINLEDTTWRFRVNLRVADLVESLTKHGQQLPVILRQVDGAAKLQVISGFRRLTALEKIGWTEANAIVLTDVSDEQAFKVSVLENEARKTYNDLDRAYAIWQYRKMGREVADIAQSVFRLSTKQVERLQSLLKLPKVMQDAIAEEGKFTTTHAIVLKQLADKRKDKDVDFDFAPWVTKVEAESLSIKEMRQAVVAMLEGSNDNASPALFVTGKDKDSEEGFIRFRPVRLNPEQMTKKEKEALVSQLREALGL